MKKAQHSHHFLLQILFDDYYNYPNWQDHEFRGFKEFVEQHNIKYEYIAYSVTGQQAAVKILENPIYKSNQE